LPRIASDCIESTDRALTSEKSCSVDDQKNQSDAGVCRADPRLSVSKGQGKGNTKSR